MKFTATTIREWDTFRERGGRFIAGRRIGQNWIPARPLYFGGLAGAWQRVKSAWGVLTGRYDALDWEDEDRA